MVEGVQTDDGTFQRPTLDDIETRREDKALAEFGDDVALSQGSPIKQLLDVGTLEHERLWQVLEHLYYSGYYEDAFGVQLDKILSLANIERRPRLGATGAVVFQTNQPNTQAVTIPRGTEVTTEPGAGRPGIPFKTVGVDTLPAGDLKTDPIPIKALEPWETEVADEWLGAQTNVAANTVTRLPSPIQGIDSVFNPYPTGQTNTSVGYDYVLGRDRETDHELRRRWEQSLGSEGAASLDAIRANVLEVPGVMDIAIEENVTQQDNTADGGLPPKSFRVTVLGGADSEIAQALTDTRAAGIRSYGALTATSVTADGIERTEAFDRATQIAVYVDVDLQVSPAFPSDGNKRVENAIVEYIGGTTVDGNTFHGLEMGEDVLWQQVWKRAIDIQGVDQADVWIDTTEPPAQQAPLTIARKEAAQTGGGRITVTNDQ